MKKRQFGENETKEVKFLTGEENSVVFKYKLGEKVSNPGERKIYCDLDMILFDKGEV